MRERKGGGIGVMLKLARFFFRGEHAPSSVMEREGIVPPRLCRLCASVHRKDASLPFSPFNALSCIR